MLDDVDVGECIQWAVDHEDDSIHFLGLLMDCGRKDGPAKIPVGLQEQVLAYLQLLRWGQGPPDRHPGPLPRRPLGYRLPPPQGPPL